MTKEQIEQLAEQKYPRPDGWIVGDCYAKRQAYIAGATAALSQSPVWVDADTPPKEGGRYWCNVEEVDDLGISHYQWNCGYDPDEKRWYDKDLKGRVTHWTNLLPSPPTKL